MAKPDIVSCNDDINDVRSRQIHIFYSKISSFCFSTMTMDALVNLKEPLIFQLVPPLPLKESTPLWCISWWTLSPNPFSLSHRLSHVLGPSIWDNSCYPKWQIFLRSINILWISINRNDLNWWNSSFTKPWVFHQLWSSFSRPKKPDFLSSPVTNLTCSDGSSPIKSFHLSLQLWWSTLKVPNHRSTIKTQI